MDKSSKGVCGSRGRRSLAACLSASILAVAIGGVAVAEVAQIDMDCLRERTREALTYRCTEAYPFDGHALSGCTAAANQSINDPAGVRLRIDDGVPYRALRACTVAPPAPLSLQPYVTRAEFQAAISSLVETGTLKLPSDK